jgi:hypothetical protein
MTRNGGKGQVQGTVHIVRLYRLSLSTPSQGTVSVSKLFIILFHCSAFKLMCILLLDRSYCFKMLHNFKVLSIQYDCMDLLKHSLHCLRAILV